RPIDQGARDRRPRVLAASPDARVKRRTVLILVSAKTGLPFKRRRLGLSDKPDRSGAGGARHAAHCALP
ncbi:MAG: hypothetical protein LLG00_16465, partial [Planctomycetaceae bacterium]|nr:hypothetical protein [Planctomycetaceae bacterium]